MYQFHSPILVSPSPIHWWLIPTFWYDIWVVVLFRTFRHIYLPVFWSLSKIRERMLILSLGLLILESLKDKREGPFDSKENVHINRVIIQHHNVHSCYNGWLKCSISCWLFADITYWVPITGILLTLQYIYYLNYICIIYTTPYTCLLLRWDGGGTNSKYACASVKQGWNTNISHFCIGSLNADQSRCMFSPCFSDSCSI